MNRLIKFLALVLGSFLALYLVFSLVFYERVLPNTYFAGVDLGFKRNSEVEKLISQAVDNFSEQSLVFVAGQELIDAKIGDLGIQFDPAMSARVVLDYWGSGDFFEGQRKKILSLFYKRQVAAYYTVDNEKFNTFLNENFVDLESGAKDASIVFAQGQALVVSEKDGVMVDKVKLVNDLNSKFNTLSTYPVSVSFIPDIAQVRGENSQKALEKVKSLNSQTIVLVHKFDQWKLSGQKLFDLLKFEPEEQFDDMVTLQLGQSPILIKSPAVKSNESQLTVALDEQKLNNFIEEMATVLDQPTVNATLELEGRRVTKFTPAQDGQALDRVLLTKLLLEKLSIDNILQDKTITLELPVKLTKAKIANQEVNNLGIVELIGSGVSYFAGSIANRIHNIVLGASLINGTIIAPGETFSFNALVGAVSAEQGFKQAYVISKGRTVLDDGGGICQVSTTVFRAALNSGLAIVKRTAHAYRVSYYEQKGFKPGFDATIFSPSVDLQFKNDTAKHVLVQAKVNKANARLQVDLYGTSDLRRVEISEPVVSNVIPPPEPKYEDDPSLPKGTVKQVDFAAHGATTIFTRKVYKGEDLIINDVIRSNFKPWQAVYLVGVGG